jgi:hypothetical protein
MKQGTEGAVGSGPNRDAAAGGAFDAIPENERIAPPIGPIAITLLPLADRLDIWSLSQIPFS